MLKQIQLHNVGPASEIGLSLDPRMNLLTGDNGMGKSFMLECCWWALTGTWSKRPLRPSAPKTKEATIRYKFDEKDGDREGDSFFDPEKKQWRSDQRQRARTDALVIMANVDGGFSVSFPKAVGVGGKQEIVQFSREEVWDGLKKRSGTIVCEGLVRDVTSWQERQELKFESLARVAEMLSPRFEVLRFGKPKRLFVDDPRLQPVLILPYGEVPVAEASAGMRRILALAYMLVWAWHENLERAKLQERAPAEELILIVDEIEAHLHPEWQRTIMPSVMKVIEDLAQKNQRSMEGRFQFIGSTHAPLVLASLETLFDEPRDQLFIFRLEGGQAVVSPVEWSPFGTAASWLTSQVFGLKHARSREAEEAVGAALAFMVGETSDLPDGLRTKQQIHKELIRCLPGHDPFWARWIVKTNSAE